MADINSLNRSKEGTEKEEGTSLRGPFLFGFIGAAATTYAVGLMRHRPGSFRDGFQQINRTKLSWKGGASHSFRNFFQEEGWRKYQSLMREKYEEHTGRAGQLRQSTADWLHDIRQRINRVQSSWREGSSHPFRGSSQKEAWRKYQRRMREEYEDEMERVERIRRVQSVFNRERSKNKRTYESWKENESGAFNQHFQREDWYWKADTSYKNQRTNYKEPPKSGPSYTLSRHYAVLGLKRSPVKPYTEAEIKSAFRAKAMQYHPDQNQDDKEAAEAKFKEVLSSYEAIRSERKQAKS